MASVGGDGRVSASLSLPLCVSLSLSLPLFLSASSLEFCVGISLPLSLCLAVYMSLGNEVSETDRERDGKRERETVGEKEQSASRTSHHGTERERERRLQRWVKTQWPSSKIYLDSLPPCDLVFCTVLE